MPDAKLGSEAHQVPALHDMYHCVPEPPHWQVTCAGVQADMPKHSSPVPLQSCSHAVDAGLQAARFYSTLCRAGSLELESGVSCIRHDLGAFKG